MDLRFLHKPKKDLTGSLFNNWIVLGLSHRGEDKKKWKGIWYWDIRCIKCGVETKRQTAYLKKSIGCFKCSNKNSLYNIYESILNEYKYSAKNRNLSFELTGQEFEKLINLDCFYCGCPPSKVKILKNPDILPYFHNGIDRMNNKLGYTLENCVSCCSICNKGKKDFPYNIWCNYINGFLENSILNKIECFSTNLLKEHTPEVTSNLDERCNSGLCNLLRSYKNHAREKNIDFILDKTIFKKLTSSKCYYCGNLPSLIKKSRTKSNLNNYIYNGIDRMDNNLGYNLNNCVPCCEFCNRAKSGMDYDLWITFLLKKRENFLFNKVNFIKNTNGENLWK